MSVSERLEGIDDLNSPGVKPEHLPAEMAGSKVPATGSMVARATGCTSEITRPNLRDGEVYVPPPATLGVYGYPEADPDKHPVPCGRDDCNECNPFDAFGD